MLFLQRHDAQQNSEQHADDGERPDVAEGCLDMVLDVHVGEADAQEGGRHHRADEGCAVSANHHRDGDWHRVDAEAGTDADHDRQHAVEILVMYEIC